MMFFVNRLISATAVLLLVSLAAFILMRIVPGDPARLVMGPLASEEAVQGLREEMGLDRPMFQQYARYLVGLLGGDWGTAWHTRQPVADIIAMRLPASLELAISALIIAIGIGIPIGAVAALKCDAGFDRATRAGSLVLLGTPPFWLGLVLILLGFSWLGLAPPPFERLTPGLGAPDGPTGFLLLDAILSGKLRILSDAAAHLVLPALTLGLPLAAWLALITRRSVLDAYGAEYIKTARSKGVGEVSILFRHALPNALLPILTLSTLAFGDLIAGSIMVETVFSWPAPSCSTS